MNRKKWMLRLLALTLIMSASVPNTLAAGKECLPLIQAADQALEAKQKQIEIRDLRIQQASDEINRLVIEVDKKDTELGAFYRNPFIMGLVGALTAAILLK